MMHDYSAPYQVMETMQELMARPFLTEKVSCQRESLPRFSLTFAYVLVFLVDNEIWGQPGQSNHPHVFSPPRSGIVS